MSLNLRIPEAEKKSDNPKILIFGVGGAGCNAVDNMIQAGLDGVDFVAVNADSQALHNSSAPHKIRIGGDLTKGLGAGSYSEIGRAAAIISKDEIAEYLEDCDMLFITAGMGGGTGTGASPVIAKIAKDKGILVVSVVAKPFDFEGAQRMRNAENGIKRLRKYADTLIVIPNQNLFRVSNSNTTFENAFQKADAVLHAGVRSITDLITLPGLINLDFADIRAIMGKMGKAMMGTGEATGSNRAIMAAEAAICNPLLDNVSIKGARGILINITGGPDMTLFEVDEATRRISSEVDPNANIIFGSAFNTNMNGKMKISVVATGINSDEVEEVDETYDEDFNFDREQVESLLKRESKITDNTRNLEVGVHEEKPAEAKAEPEATNNNTLGVTSKFFNLGKRREDLHSETISNPDNAKRDNNGANRPDVAHTNSNGVAHGDAANAMNMNQYGYNTVAQQNNTVENADYFDFGTAVNPDYLSQNTNPATTSPVEPLIAEPQYIEQSFNNQTNQPNQPFKPQPLHYKAMPMPDLDEPESNVQDKTVSSQKDTADAKQPVAEKRKMVAERHAPTSKTNDNFLANDPKNVADGKRGGLFSFVGDLVGGNKHAKQPNNTNTANVGDPNKKSTDNTHNDHTETLFDQDGNIIINDEINNIPAILRRKQQNDTN